MDACAQPPRLFRRLLAVTAGWLLAGTLVAQAAAPGTPTQPDEAQRAAFRQAYAAAQQGGDGWRQLAAGLQNYPLYPYLEAAALTHDLRQLNRAPVQEYLQTYPDMIPANDLRRDFLLELARRQDWNDFLALYRPGLGDALSCDALQARLSQGGKLDFDKDLAALWSKPNLPDACDDVLQAARKQGLLTPARLWARIDRATEAGKGGTVAQLAGWLPASDAVVAERYAQALRDPASAVASASAWPDTARSRQAAALALQRLARRQSAAADNAWQQLQHRLAFTPAQRDGILQSLAVFHATDFDETSLERLIALPASAQNDSTREWRVRVALAQQDWHAVIAAIAAMPASQQNDAEWRYFRARAQGQLGHAAEAKRLYATLAGEPGYFGFLAADRLGSGYAICPLTLAENPQREQALLAMPGLRRAFELYAVGLPRLARREWALALDGADPETLQQAAALAWREGWYDRSVFAFNSGRALRYYEQRFPLPTEDGVEQQSKQAGIDPAWAYGILRVESAWVTDARSGADARGLMQLLPDTAAQVARRSGLGWSGGDSLYDPAVNVSLGTRYLAQLAERFNGSPWLASAAYNAGPVKVEQWLDAHGSLPPDLFVASMPYKETREYVARVLAFSVIYDWRMHGDALPLSSRMPAIGTSYSLPDVHTSRLGVTCPAGETSVAPVAPTSSASSAGDVDVAH